MSSDQATQDLKRLEAERERLHVQLADVESRLVKVKHYIEIAQLYDEGKAASTLRLPASRVSGPTKGMSATVAAVVDILRESGAPMPTADLVKELANRGTVIGSQNPITNLSGSLSKHKELLVASRKHGWSLKEWSANETEGSETQDHIAQPHEPPPSTVGTSFWEGVSIPPAPTLVLDDDN